MNIESLSVCLDFIKDTICDLKNDIKDVRSEVKGIKEVLPDLFNKEIAHCQAAAFFADHDKVNALTNTIRGFEELQKKN